MRLVKDLPETGPRHQKPDQVRAISATKTEITVTIDQETYEMLEKIKNLTAHHKLDEVLKLMAKATLEKLAKKPKTEKSSSPEKLSHSRYVPAEIDQCSYTDPQTKRSPLTLGGTTRAENLRLLCRTHNQYAAVKALGRLSMQFYLSALR